MLMSPETFVLDSTPVAIQDKTHALDRYAHVQLTPTQKGTVVFHKLEGQTGISDTQHDLNSPWHIQCTAVEEGDLAYNAMGVRDTTSGNFHKGSFTDDGFIFTFHGTPSGVVALDANSRRILPETEAQMMETTFGQTLPRYTKWDFRIHSIISTDGPSARLRAMESNEQARARSEERMMGKQEEFFGRLIQMITAKGGEGVIPVSELKNAIQDAPITLNLTPEQQAAQKEIRDIEAEHARERGGAVAQGGRIDVSSKPKEELLNSLQPLQKQDPMKPRR